MDSFEVNINFVLNDARNKAGDSALKSLKERNSIPGPTPNQLQHAPQCRPPTLEDEPGLRWATLVGYHLHELFHARDHRPVDSPEPHPHTMVAVHAPLKADDTKCRPLATIIWRNHPPLAAHTCRVEQKSSIAFRRRIVVAGCAF